jgi:gamma-glutamyl hercynylcysteine S-oxide synthase
VTITTSHQISEILLAEYKRVKQKTQEIFSSIHPEAYYSRPIPLRHAIVFYDGHIDAFAWNTLFRRVLGRASFNAHFDKLFERGIDPANLTTAQKLEILDWPDRACVTEYREEITQRLYQFIEKTDFEKAEHPLLKNGYIIYLMIEHELMHQETLLYIIHQLPKHLKQKPTSITEPPVPFKAPVPTMVKIPKGSVQLGAKPAEFDFMWDNESPAIVVEVDPFLIDTLPVTNGDYLAFVEAGGYQGSYSATTAYTSIFLVPQKRRMVL